jgi:hypothetical protein
MTRAFLLMLGLLLAGAGARLAQGLPEGTFASTKEGCEKLATKANGSISAPSRIAERF